MDRRTYTILFVVAVVLIVLFVFRGCEKLEFKNKSNDDKSKLSLEIKK